MDTPSVTPVTIIERFGGRRALAERLGIPASTVGNWPSLGIPSKWFPRLRELAAADGLELSWEELWQTTKLRRAG
jgi:hypothetical protein